MTPAHRLTRDEARRIAVRAQLLAAPRPSGLPAIVSHLTLLPTDGTAAVAPAADLVLFSRRGPGHEPQELRDALDAGALVQLRGAIRPAEDIALYRADMAAWPGPPPLRPWQETLRTWVSANDACRRDLLARLRDAGPLGLADLPDTCVVPWRSSGWSDHRNVERLLDLMVQRGEVAVAGQEGRDRLWDLAERIYPDDPIVPADEARRRRDALRLRSLGLARGRAAATTGEPLDVGDAGEPAVVEGMRGTWRVDPAALDQPFTGRTALLSPFDRLVVDRRRLTELFEFDYQLEMYKPAAARRWGYFALPVLHGDRLVGKLDAAADRAHGVLRVRAVHQDAGFTHDAVAAVDAEIEDLARWLELDVVRGD